MSLEDCEDNELPFGWERIDDPHYGTYYIDHVNRRTQFENPVIQAKQSKGSLTGSPSEVGETMRQHIGPPKNPFPPRYSSANPPPPNPKPVNPNRLSVPRGKTPVDLPPDQLPNDSHSALPHINHSAMPNMSSSNGLRVKNAERPSHRFFTRDPSQLIGERISTSLMKSSRGLGFTIVGGDDDDGLDEFLQIK
jgi:atrophin-1 interacting protein 3 (BAI1-associated protein 1)